VGREVGVNWRAGQAGLVLSGRKKTYYGGPDRGDPRGKKEASGGARESERDDKSNKKITES